MTVWQPGAEMQGGAWPGCRWGPRLSWGLSPPSMGTAMGTAAGCAALTVSAQVPVAFLPSHRVSPAWAAVTLQTRHVRMGPLFSQLSSPTGCLAQNLCLSCYLLFCILLRDTGSSATPCLRRPWTPSHLPSPRPWFQQVPLLDFPPPTLTHPVQSVTQKLQ